MNTTSTQFQSFQKPLANSADRATFAIDIDPISDANAQTRQDTVRLGPEMVRGAFPVLGTHVLLGDALDLSMRDKKGHANLAICGSAMNTFGTLGLALAGAQAVFGLSPVLALQVSGGLLAGAGLVSGLIAHSLQPEIDSTNPTLKGATAGPSGQGSYESAATKVARDAVNRMLI